MSDLPDFETLVIERLTINLSEIVGIKTVFENPPSMKAGVSDAPFAFPLVGGMVNSIPQQTTGSGRLVVTRNYPVSVFGIKLEQDADGERGEGAKGYKALRLLIAPVREYFMTHASLETDAGDKLDKLQYIQQQITLQEQGIALDDKENRYVLQFTLTVSMGATIKRLA